MASSYWRAVYTYLRLRFRRSPEMRGSDAGVLRARPLDKGWLEADQPVRGRFRTYLRTCLDAFAANQNQAERRLKRGGGATVSSLDFAGLEGEVRALELPAPDADVEELFHREWIQLLARAVEDLEDWFGARGKDAVWEVFRRYDLEGGNSTYSEVARELWTAGDAGDQPPVRRSARTAPPGRGAPERSLRRRNRRSRSR